MLGSTGCRLPPPSLVVGSRSRYFGRQSRSWLSVKPHKTQHVLCNLRARFYSDQRRILEKSLAQYKRTHADDHKHTPFIASSRRHTEHGNTESAGKIREDSRRLESNQCACCLPGVRRSVSSMEAGRECFLGYACAKGSGGGVSPFTSRDIYGLNCASRDAWS